MCCVRMCVDNQMKGGCLRAEGCYLRRPNFLQQKLATLVHDLRTKQTKHQYIRGGGYHDLDDERGINIGDTSGCEPCQGHRQGGNGAEGKHIAQGQTQLKADEALHKMVPHKEPKSVEHHVGYDHGLHAEAVHSD